MTIKAINVRNQFRGFVKEIDPGPVLSEVDVRPEGGGKLNKYKPNLPVMKQKRILL